MKLDQEKLKTSINKADEKLVMSNRFARSDCETLEDVITAIDMDGGVARSKRKRIINDIKTACRWFGMEPAEVVAHPMNIRPRFIRLSPGGLGVSISRIQNVRSSVKIGLQYVNIIDGRSFKVPLSDSWRTLLAGLENDYARRKLRCLASYGSAHGVEPTDVNDTFNEELLTALQADRLHSNPRITHQNAVRAWNRLVDAESDEQLTKLKQPFYRKVKSPDVMPHPELQAAIEGFLVRNSTDDPFDLSTPMLPWKASTVQAYRQYLKRYFGLLVLSGHRPEELNSLWDLIPVDRVKSALKLMMAQNDGKGRIGASHIARLISQIATYLSELDTQSTDYEREAAADSARLLRELSDRLHRRNKELGQKNRERLVPLREERNMARLFLLPFALAKEVAGRKNPTRKEALQMQWAVAILILTFCPLRINSLSQLRIDKHLVWSRSGMKGELRLNFEWRELKGDTPEVLPLPSECARLIRTYIVTYRSRLNPGKSSFLFPGNFEDRGKLRNVLSQQLQSLIFKRTGFHVNPHLYRHLVHLIVLSRFPGAYAMISRVLTHRSLETAKKNYAYFDVELSMKAYHDLIRNVQSGRTVQASKEDVTYGIDREAMRDAKY